MTRLSEFSKASRIYLGYNAEGISVDPEPIQDITVDTLAPYMTQKSGSLPAGVAHTGASLVLETETTIKHQFTVDDISKYIFRMNGQEVEPETEGNRYIIKKENVNARDLDTFYLVELVDRNTGETLYSANYAGLTYAWSCLTYSQKESQLNLARTMYLYNQAANDLFEH